MFRNGEYVRCDQLNGGAKPGCQAHDERIHPTVGTAPVRLGTRDFKSFFQGGLSEVRIWSRPLQPDEITRLYRSNEVPRGGLVAAFLLDEGKRARRHAQAQGQDLRRHVGKNDRRVNSLVLASSTLSRAAIGERATGMFAVAGDLHFSARVFAALAAVGLVSRHGAPASRVRTLLQLSVSHDSCLLLTGR
jgi:hypothetical protein